MRTDEEKREKNKARQIRYRARHREKIRADEATYRRENPDKVKEHRRKHVFGISPMEFNRFHDKQGFSCRICGQTPEDPTGKAKTLHIDHNHTTGKIRGLLCRHCNTMLGYARDSIDNLRNAIQYLLDTQ
jgi:hypothetical protein